MVKNLIYDVGMFDGTDTLNYLSKGYDVVAIEADPGLAANAQKKFARYIRAGRLTIINKGIAEKAGPGHFFISKDMPHWNSFHADITGRDNLSYQKIEIECVRFDDILEERGVPYYLKIDIEGNDIYCLKALKRNDLPQYISFEADNKGNAEMLDLLRDLSYSRFQCINQNTFTPITVPYRSTHNYKEMKWNDRVFLRTMYSKNLALRVARKLNGRNIFNYLLNPSPHLAYPISSSGPFGQYLSDSWLTYDRVRELYLQSYESFRKDHKDSQYGFWCDFHAGL